MNDKIEEGDLVDIYLDYGSWLRNRRVLYTPKATGDCWHFKSEDGTITYVQQFLAINLREKGV